MKKLTRADIVFCIFLVCAIVFMIVAPIVILPKIYGVQNIWNKNLPQKSTFVELWEVDTFEGGTASRSRYLEKLAFKFQELNNNVYIFVRTLDVNEMKAMLEQGKVPDMISFGIGVGDILKAYCRDLDIKTPVRSEVLASGMVGDKVKAMPWCMGGYMLATTMDIDLVNLPHEPIGAYEKVIGYGQDGNVASNVVRLLGNTSVYGEQMSAYDAYKNFLLGNKYNVLLGTQRDYHRLQNKVNLGLVDNCSYGYLDVYNDLVQYIAITSKNEDAISCAENFIRYLTSVTVQKTLTQIGMFGVTGVRIYTEGMNEFENAVLNTRKVLNVFVSDAEWVEMRKNANNSA